MSADLSDKIKDLVRRRESVSATVNKLEAKLEAAKHNLAEVEQECRSRGIDPDKIDQFVAQLEERLANEVAALERGVLAAEQALEPYLKENP